MKRVTLFLLFIWCCCYVNAQFALKGSIVDEKHKGISYSTIQLTLKDSTFVKGEVTDSLGNFLLKDIQKGNYLLHVSAMGYETLIESININNNKILSSFILKRSEVVLNDVVVTGTSFIRQKDRVLILPDKQQVKHASTGYDVLYNLMIPGIDVNKRTGSVTAFGGTVTLYIDGEKANFRDVMNLRPRDIENIEYYDVPTGKYANDIAAINYVTKKYKSGGYIALDGKQTIGYLMGDYNLNSKIVHNNTTYSFATGSLIKKYTNDYIEKEELFHFPSNDIQRNSYTQNASHRNNQQYVTFKIKNQEKERAISGEFSLIHDKIPNSMTENPISYNMNSFQSILSKEWYKQNNIQPSMRIFGEFKFPNNHILTVNLDGNYAKNQYKRNYKENTNISYTNIDEDMYVFAFNGNYSIPFKYKNSLNINAAHNHKITSSFYTGDYDSWQHLWYGESLLLATYQQVVNKINIILRSGLSFLNYKLHNNDLQQYLSPRFNLIFLYRMNKSNQLAFYTNIANTIPDISFLNDVDQTIDFLQIQRGNPDIKNSKIYNIGTIFNVQVNKLNLQANIDYMLFKDNVFYHYSFEEDKLVRSFYQEGNAHIFKSKVGATYRFSDNFRLKISGLYSYERVNNMLYDIYDHIFQGTLDFNYFWKNFSINLYSSASTNQMSVWTLIHKKTPLSYGLSIGWSHNGWNIEIGTESPFTKHRYFEESADYNIYRYNQKSTSRVNQQNAYIKLSYTVDFGRKTTHESIDVNRTINSAILKVR